MVAAVLGASQGGSGCPELREYLCGGGSGGHDLQVGDVGNDTTHQEDFRRIPPQVDPQADGETTLERTGWGMGVFPTGGSDGRGGITVGGYLCLPPPEQILAVHCYQAHYGPVSGGGAKSGVEGVQVVLGAGRLGLGGEAKIILGGGMD